MEVGTGDEGEDDSDSEGVDKTDESDEIDDNDEDKGALINTFVFEKLNRNYQH